MIAISKPGKVLGEDPWNHHMFVSKPLYNSSGVFEFILVYFDRKKIIDLQCDTIFVKNDVCFARNITFRKIEGTPNKSSTYKICSL